MREIRDLQYSVKKGAQYDQSYYCPYVLSVDTEIVPLEQL